jgi:hypothetical protein
MARSMFALGLVAMSAALAGCRMGCHPYDNCGPVWSGGACQTCNPNYRAGSILCGDSLLGGGPLMGGQPMANGATTASGRATPGSEPRGRMPGMIADSEFAAEPVPTPAPTRATRPTATKTRAAHSGNFDLTTPPATAGAAKKSVRPAPAGTREGTTKVLDVQDRKADGNPPAPSDDPLPGASDKPAASDGPEPGVSEKPALSDDPPAKPQPPRQARAARSMARRMQLNVW